MRTAFKSLILTFCFLSSLAFSQQFEGELTIEAMGEQGEQETILMVMGNGSSKIVAETPEGKVELMVKDEKLFVIMHAAQMIMEMPATPEDANETESEAGDFIRTSEVKNILGYDCVLYTTKDEEGTEMDLWITDKLGSFMFLDAPAFKGINKNNADIDFKSFFPMQMYRTIGGKKEEAWRVTEIKERTVDASEFEVPEGYSNLSDVLKGQ